MSETAASTAKEMIFLSSEDRNRMTRLYEEVFTRLEEMAMITGRVLKIDSCFGAQIKFSLLEARQDVDFSPVEIISTPEIRGCYDYKEGACFEA